MKSEHDNKWEKEFEPFGFTFYSTNMYWELLFASIVLNDESACLSVLSGEWLFAILGTVAHQAPLSWDFLGKNTGLCDAVSSSRGSSWPRDQTCISCVSCIGRQILYCWAIGEDGEMSCCLLRWTATSSHAQVQSLSLSFFDHRAWSVHLGFFVLGTSAANCH